MKNLDELKIKDKIIEMYYFKNLTINEIKKEINYSPVKIKNIIFEQESNNPTPSHSYSSVIKYENEISELYIKNLELKSNKKTSLELYNKFLVLFPNSNIKKYVFTQYLTILRKNKITDIKKKCMPILHKNNECQLDFGYCIYIKDGKETRAQFVNLSFPHSNACYCQLLTETNLQFFFQSIINIFNYLKGSPKEIWFDNDSMFFYSKKPKRLYEKFIAFADYYNFKSVFCTIKSPNQKGHVEKSIKFIRDNIFIPPPKIRESIEEYNKKLLKRCDSLHFRKCRNTNTSILEILKNDISSFNILPEKQFENILYKIVSLDKFSRFQYNKNYYYLPLSLVYKNFKYTKIFVKLKITTSIIYIYNKENNKLLDIYHRLYNNEIYKINDWGEYLPILAKEYQKFFSIPFFISLPFILQEFLLFLNPLETKNFLSYMYYVYKKYNYNTCIKTSCICVLKNKISKHDFFLISNRLKKNPYYNPEN